MTILFTDDFDRGDSASLGAAWVEDADNYEIFSNEVRSDLDFVNNTSGTSAWVTSLAARADATVQALLKSSVVGTNFARFGLVARRTASDTFYGFRVAPNAGNGQMIKVVGGVQTNLGIGFSVGDNLVYHSFRFEVFGTSLKVYRDGVLRESLTDSSISAAGRVGLLLSGDADGDRAFANDFIVADSPGENLLVTSTIPVDWRTLVELPHIVPVYYSFANMLNINPVIPVAYRLSAVFDEVVPIFWKFPTPLNLDHTVPVQWRRILEVDLTIPIQYGQLDPWTPQNPGESDVWVKQTDSQADAWAAAGAGEASTWSPV